MAFYSLPFRAGDRILTAVAEYASNYIAFLQIAQRNGAVVEVIPDDESGQVSVEALAGDDRRTREADRDYACADEWGLVNPAAEIGRIARDANVLYLLDACQSVGQMPIDVETIRCDILSSNRAQVSTRAARYGFLVRTP